MDCRQLVFVSMLVIAITSHASSDDTSSKVSMSLYYEALCPYCANFIVNDLQKILTTDLLSILNLRLVPWGNAAFKDDKTWACQHGPDECLLDTVEACAINVHDLGTHFRFIRCVERLNLENRHTEWQSCFRTGGLNPKPIADCYNTGLGFLLERRYADETARLNPPHQYVPWVLVNNVPIGVDYRNFVAYVCKAYRGPSIPIACKSPLFDINSSEKKNTSSGVCYAGEMREWHQ
ncbi:gamma-interferon-responsive lysosomal thiol protein-like [Cornus florida]|uniref:gamma-interferon-responsive lysosomal thiol protein-like n=1 Tax=Cornus florida TaxID=4283 RepID=UPI00289E6C30|nr:gamma-interferon-responsive lysosomal thiol protein-like [Cornus florida]